MTTTTVQNQTKTNNGAQGKQPKTYGKIVLTLHNCLLPETAFKETPSQTDGLDFETETDLRILGCEMIQTAGILLKLPQVAMATGQMYLQRFYYSKSFVRYPMETTAMGSIYLASKVEEKPCRIRDVINVFHHIKQVRAQRTISPLIVDQNYIELKNQVIKAERRILKELGFCVHVKHPHKLIVVYLQLLQYEENKQLMQMAWNYMNDALRTDVFMRFPPETIACACIYLTARKIGLPLPNNPHWFQLFKVTEDDIRNVCIRILQLYKRPKVNPEELESKVDALRKVYQANKHIQAQKERDAKIEEKKATSPTASTSKESKRDVKKDKSPKTPPLSSKYHSSHKKRERRSRSPYDRKREYSSKRHKSRSRDRDLDRSRERRLDDKRNRGSSRKYNDYDRSKVRDRDEKRKH
ncbi:cyclin-L1 [Danaus plexippus]|uniref:Cyclin L1 n=1 Tax=Danaus plexippus plexippus TaxID=278856 RepID=A0A212ELQ9_DANPL|nr:cyclin-L1 [Danaus plexippus]OWR42408.1 cyclin L1 [Danaus plexippus plexippus]